MGPDNEVFDSGTLSETATMVTIPNESLEPNTMYRIEVETLRGGILENQMTNGNDSYRLGRFYEDINSIVVPELNALSLQVAAVAWLSVVTWARRRR